MEHKTVSSWFNEKKLPTNYILPAQKRPKEISCPPCRIPVIDLGLDRSVIVEQIMHSCKTFGFFQVINHGVPKEVMDDTMKVFKEFFELPSEDKSYLYSEEINNDSKCKLYTSSLKYANEDIHYWRDVLKHDCYPLDECLPLWPQKPANYRKIVGKYSIQVKELGLRILDLICEGLELESGYFANDYSQVSIMNVNHYPPCPDPSLTLGIPKHSDANLITLLLQDNVPGLHVYVDNKWVLVEPCRHAFVINMGYQMEAISNGRLRSVEHRAVTNAEKARTSAAFFIFPSKDCIVQPALVNDSDQPLFKPFKCWEFFKNYLSKNGTENFLDHYRIKK